MNHTRHLSRLTAPLAAAILLSPAVPALGHNSTEPILGLDRNNNHISDVYEAYFPGALSESTDYDKDGFSDAAEAAAGTSSWYNGSYPRITSVSVLNGNISVVWPAAKGKSYQLEMQTREGWVPVGQPLYGVDGQMAATAPLDSTRRLLRVRISDQDSDADGVTDWEEFHLGTDPVQWDSDGDGRSDRGLVESRMSAASVVEVFPVSTWAAESGPRTAQFRVVRRGGWKPLTVNFTTGGAAVKGADYTLSGTTVYIPPGAQEGFLTVTPLADTTAEPSEAVTLTLAAGTGYSIGTASAATITILAQGLNAEYFENANGTYSNTAENFAPEETKQTGTVPNMDLRWTAGRPLAAMTDDNVWTARFSGMIYPKVSGLNQIHAYADRGVVVWVSRTPITAAPGQTTGSRINQWSTTNATTKYTANLLASSANAVAGEPLYFRVDYRDSAGTLNSGSVQLRWSGPGLAEEIIPASSFSPQAPPGGVPVITSPQAAGGIVGAPFSLQLTASNGPAVWTAGGLPAGLSISADGLITGTLTAAAGYHFFTVTASTAAGSDTQQITLFVTTTGGSATRETWTVTSGTGLNAVPWHTAPAASSTVNSLEAVDNAGDNFGERVRGYITAPDTGLYTFFLTSDETAELWISASEEPAQRLKRAWSGNGTAIADGVWDAQPSQKSVTMRMVSGQRYYFEVLRRETAGPDHLAVAWLKPGVTDPAQREIIPGWALTRYTAATTGTGVQGTLYAATLTPQAGANTLGSGSALLLVNETRTEAKLSYTFSNLTGPVNSGAHIHDARTITGQAGRIIYDIDDFEPDAFGQYPWFFEANVSHTVADILSAIEGGHAYINLHTAAYPNGEIKGTFYPVIGSQFFVPPAAPPAAELTLPADPATAKREAVRFLQQATFGARHDADGTAPWDADSIESVLALGYAGWVDAQLAMPAGTNPEIRRDIIMPPATVYTTPANNRTAPNTPAALFYGSGPYSAWIADYYLRYPRTSLTDDPTQSAEEIWRAWWALSVQAPDQLRHRMAFALSQILVLSEEGELDDNARAINHYYDLLYYHGLGNFRTLLERVTLNPSMGVYLDMLGNKKPNPATGYIPNENFAREILQLFSIGLLRLHPDGSAVLSSRGTPVPTYEQDNIVGFAHTFTGWNYPGSSGDKITAMTPRATDHDTGAKLLLEGATLPAVSPATTESCQTELTAALDIIFHHPNTAPFICRQLIQRLVTANPSPGYIYRVSSVFENDGTGTRGNLSAVARAILLDPEARNQQPRTQTGYGHLKEPVIRATQMLRAFKGFSYAERTHGSSVDLGAALTATQANLDLTQPLPTTNFTINSVATPYTVVDGVVLGAGSQVLVKAQTNAAENGLYTFSGNGQPLTRSATADSPDELNMAWIRVVAGTNTEKYFRQTAAIAAVGTSPQTWAEQTGGNPRRRLWGMGSTNGSFQQTPLRSPTVFNFFEPNYVYLGYTGENGLYAPEFQITTETTVISTGQWFYDFTRHNTTDTASPHTNGQGYDHGGSIKRDIKLDLTAQRSLAADPAALLDHTGDLLMPGMMNTRYRELIGSYLTTLPAATDADKMKRVSEALYLISLTPEFTWQK